VTVPERAALAHALPALGHQLQHDVEGGLVVVEDHHVLAGVRQLERRQRYSEAVFMVRMMKMMMMRPHLGHDHVLTLLHVLALGLDDGVQEVEVLHVAPVRGEAVDEVLQDALGDLAAQLVVVTEDVLHSLRLQQLHPVDMIIYSVIQICSY